MYTYLCMGDGSASVATNVETRKKPDCGDKNPECLPSKLKVSFFRQLEQLHCIKAYCRRLDAGMPYAGPHDLIGLGVSSVGDCMITKDIYK